MIIGIGTDILKISQLCSNYLKPEDPFVKKVFSQKEILEAGKRKLPLFYFATRFAGKEAVFKSLRISPERIRLSEIEILNDTWGAPYVTLYGELKKIAEDKKIQKIHISLSYEEEYATAFAVAESTISPEN